MEHHFNVEIAKEYGITQAIILNNLYYWISKNIANNKHFYDGNYWTYNSKKAFSGLFPYLTERQIDYSLKKLIDDGLIVKGNYNKMAYDRTLWYAITKKGYSILQNCKMEDTNMLNGLYENVEPIPNNKPNNKKSNNKHNIHTESEAKKTYGAFKRIKLTDKEYERLCNEFSKEFIDYQIMQLDEYVESNNNKNKYSNFNLVLRKAIREKWFKGCENNGINNKPIEKPNNGSERQFNYDTLE